MSEVDLDYLRSWIGKTHGDEDVIDARHARLMAATVDDQAERIRDGTALPPLWHWLYFLEAQPASALGRDGHPARGGFLPPVPLPNRMWAGGRVSFLAPIPIGSASGCARRRGFSPSNTSKGVRANWSSSRSSTVSTRQAARRCCARSTTSFYKTAVSGGTPSRSSAEPLEGATRLAYTPTSTTLFRYSALTFNGHRIHYDADYCREVEGYRNLVIHGPLTATRLAGFAESVSGERLQSFSYRGVAPAILGDTITLHAARRGDRVQLQAVLGDGTLCMQAEAGLA